MPALGLQLDTSRLAAAAARFSGVAGRDVRSTWQLYLKGMVRRVVGLTPPALGRNVTGGSARGVGGGLTTADKRRGEAAIARDLGAIFQPVERAGARNNPLVAQDVAGIHRAVFVAKKVPGRPLKNTREQPYLVDETRLRALERSLRKKVGRLAGQWNSGVTAIGARSPAWVARHGTSNGTHRLVYSAGNYAFQMSATDVPDAIRGELIRRIGYAVAYQERAGQRQMEAILLKAAGRSGFAAR